MRNYHPVYEKDGGVPAIRELKHSLVSNRGCFGGCSFCALTFHQGRIIQCRSHESIIEEAKIVTEDPEFKGYIYPHDYENDYVKQNYLPNDLIGKKYYEFGNNKTEQAAKAYHDFIVSNCKNAKKK